MKLQEFLEKIPAEFVIECLEDLPGVDRRRLLQAHKCRIKMGPGALNRKARLKKEAARLHKVLLAAEDVEEKRTLFQGWLAHRVKLIIALLDAWEIEHNGGFVEDFDWVEKLSKEQVQESMTKVRADLSADNQGELATDKGFLVYFAYLEMPLVNELFPNFDDIFQSPAKA